MENEINNLIVQDHLSNEEIKNLIYTIRGKQETALGNRWTKHPRTKKWNQME